MNKSELIKQVAKKTGATQADTEKTFVAMFDTITDALIKGEKVQLVGFGGFEVHNRAARIARNPRTGEAIAVAPSRAPVFKAGKALKEAISAKKADK